jgi:hypothetical protein
MDEAEFLDARRRLRRLTRWSPHLAREVRGLDARLAATDLPALWRRAAVGGGRAKYLDIPGNFLRQLRHARALGLHRASPGAVLDIGAGGGYFCYAAALLGHAAVAIQPTDENRSAEAVFSALLDFHGVARSAQRIAPRTSIVRDAALGERRFDLVTAFALTFNVLETDARPYWGAGDYLFLLRDLRERVLAPGGRVALKFQQPLYGASDPAAPAEEGAYHLALGELLRPFLVRYDMRGGPDGGLAVLDPFRDEAWTRAESVGLPAAHWDRAARLTAM